CYPAHAANPTLEAIPSWQLEASCGTLSCGRGNGRTLSASPSDYIFGVIGAIVGAFGTILLPILLMRDRDSRYPFNERANSGGPVDGGGINNLGTLSVTNSTFNGNFALAGRGGIENQGILEVANSTFSGNSAQAGGGIDNKGSLTVTNSTFSHNIG